jgi:hypothetical protein
MQTRTIALGPQPVWSDGATTLFHPMMAPMSSTGVKYVRVDTELRNRTANAKIRIAARSSDDWKFAAFCGSDEFVVAHFACANQAWGEVSFKSQAADDHPGDVGNLGHVASRAVLIRRADGMHWDLTTLVAEALGVDELATDDPNDRIFATMPTCGPLQRRTFPVVAGGQLNARAHRMHRSDAGD